MLRFYKKKEDLIEILKIFIYQKFINYLHITFIKFTFYLFFINI